MQLYALLIQRHLAVSGGKILARNSLFGEDNFGQARRGGARDRKKILRRIWIQGPSRKSCKGAIRPDTDFGSFIRRDIVLSSERETGCPESPVGLIRTKGARP